MVTRVLFNKRTGTPIRSVTPKNGGSSLLLNEESVLIGYGLVSGPETRIAIYQTVDGKPRSVGFYSPKKGGIKTLNRGHQGPLNYLQGILSNASVGTLKPGSYHLPVAPLAEPGKPHPALSVQECVKSVVALQPSEPVKMDILTIDEIGAPNKVSEICLKAKRLRQTISNHLLASLWGSNPGFVQLWRNALNRGVELWATHSEPQATAATAAIQEQLHDELGKHARQHWVVPGKEGEKAQWRRDFFPKLATKVGRIIDFYPTLVQQPDNGTYTLQVCENNKPNTDTVALFVGITGDPVIVQSANVPRGWLFPKNWTTSPFETLR